jgi:hypothetical protein
MLFEIVMIINFHADFVARLSPRRQIQFLRIDWLHSKKPANRSLNTNL